MFTSGSRNTKPHLKPSDVPVETSDDFWDEGAPPDEVSDRKRQSSYSLPPNPLSERDPVAQMSPSGDVGLGDIGQSPPPAMSQSSTSTTPSPPQSPGSTVDEGYSPPKHEKFDTHYSVLQDQVQAGMNSSVSSDIDPSLRAGSTMGLAAQARLEIRDASKSSRWTPTYVTFNRYASVRARTALSAR